MGIFSSKEVVTAGVSVSHIVEEKPDIMRDAVLTMVMTGRPISDVIMSNGVRGFASKVEKYFKFGKTDYALGLPDGSSVRNGASNTTIKVVLDLIAEEPVTLFNVFMSTPRTEYIAFQYLQEEFGFRFSDKKILTPPVDGSTRDFYYVNQSIDSAGVLIIEYYSSAPATPNETGYITTTIGSYKPQEFYYNISYYLDSDVNQKLIFWCYRIASNTYPSLSLDIVKDGSTEYLPIITLRSNKKNLSSNTSSAEFLTAEKMAYSVGIDIVDVTENLMSTDNGNDPDAIDSAFLVFAANVQSDSKSTIKYLYAYLKHIAKTQYTDKTGWDLWASNGKNGDAPVNMIDISDGNMRTTIFYNYMETLDVTGSIGVVGALTRTTVLMPAEGDIEYSKLIFRKQVTPTVYEEFIVHGLKHVSHAYYGKIVIRTLADSTKINENLKPEGGFFFPVSRNIALDLSAIDRSTMYLDSFAVVVYTVQITKVKWYQQGWFKLVLVIIAIVYAIYTQDWSQVVNAVTALQTAATVVATLIINAAIIKAFAMAANLIGGDAAAIITTIAAIYAIYQGALTGDSALPWAKDLLNAALLSYQGIQVSLQQDFLDMQRGITDFLKSEQEALEELKNRYDSFEQGIDLLYLMSPQYYFNPYESPSEFYQRSVEIKNPGVVSFEALSDYFSRKTMLPKLSASDMITGYSE